MWLTINSGPDSGTSVEVRGERWVIGRDSACDLVLDDEKVSREHAYLEAIPGDGAVVHDLNSSNGTFVNGRRITDAVQLQGGERLRFGTTTLACSLAKPAPATVVSTRIGTPAPASQQKEQLGRSTIQRIVQDAVAGEERKFRRSVRIAALIGLLGVLAAAALAGLFGTGTIGGGSSHAASVTDLERATVEIEWQSGNQVHIGSGSIIRRDGIIVTNAHVATPSAPGLDVQYGVGTSEYGAPALLSVALFQGQAKPAKPLYLATPVAYDGYLDVAVLKIVDTVDGKPVTHLDLPTVPIGDSNTVRDGEHITVVGYPAVGGGFEREINVSTGSVSGFQADPRIPTPRAWMKTDAAIAHGNSGGLAADSSGRLIGIPSRLQFGNSLLTPSQPGLDTQGKIRPIALALPLIQAAEAGHSWTSPNVVAGTGTEKFTFVHWARRQPTNTCGFDAVESYPPGMPSIVAVFRASGIALSEDLAFVGYYATDSKSKLQEFELVPSRWSKTGGSGSPCYWVTLGTQKGDGFYAVQTFAGPNLRPASNLVVVRVGAGS